MFSRAISFLLYMLNCIELQEMVAESRLRWRSACAREALSSQVSHLTTLVAQMKGASMAEQEELELMGHHRDAHDPSQSPNAATLTPASHGAPHLLLTGDETEARQWSWAQTEQAKLQLARRKQEDAARQEVERLQALLESYQTKMNESAMRAAQVAQAEQQRLLGQQLQTEAKLANAALQRERMREDDVVQKQTVAQERKALAAEQKREVEKAKQELMRLQHINRRSD